jgi:hypothetical protein
MDRNYRGRNRRNRRHRIGQEALEQWSLKWSGRGE